MPRSSPRSRARLAPLEECETVGLAAGINRVLAADVVSAVDLPAFDNAAMDGYALRAEDAGAPVTLTTIGHALAGHAYAGRVERGQAVRIMTGAALPAGADAVVMSEDTEAAGSEVRVLRAVHAGQNVRRRSEHVRAGEAVLLAGRRLRSHDIALAASVGTATLAVKRRLRVAILSTGDELVDAPAPLGGSAAYDGNRPLLAALVARAGADLIDLGISSDDEADFTARLEQAARAQADVLITTGGAAQGDADVVRKHGEVEFLPMNFRPGRGLLFGTVARSGHAMTLLGLPGNAVAAYVMYQLVARPLLGWIAGAGEEAPLTRADADGSRHARQAGARRVATRTLRAALRRTRAGAAEGPGLGDAEDPQRGRCADRSPAGRRAGGRADRRDPAGGARLSA